MLFPRKKKYRAGTPVTSRIMLIPEAHHGFGIPKEMLAEPLAQVPLLRSSQRDPSNSGHRQPTAGSAERR